MGVSRLAEAGEARLGERDVAGEALVEPPARGPEPPPPRYSRVLAVLLSVVPGWGHVYLGLEAAGFLLFALEALSLFGVLNLALSYQGGHRLLLGRVALSAAVFFCLYSILDVCRRTSRRRFDRLTEAKRLLLREGMVAYLRGDLSGAEREMRAALRLDSREPESLVRLGIVLARAGQPRAARRQLRRARRQDFDAKWWWEIDRELTLLRAARSGAAPRAGRNGLSSHGPSGNGAQAASAGGAEGAARSAADAEAPRTPRGEPHRTEA